MKIFVSHASEQSKLAELIITRLEVAGHDVFGAHRLPTAKGFDERIPADIQRCDLFVFLISRASVEPGRYTLTELSQAQARSRNASEFLLPVLVEPTPVSSVPAYARSITWFKPAGDIPAEIVNEVRAWTHRRDRPGEQRPDRPAGRLVMGGLAVAAAGILLATLIAKDRRKAPAIEGDRHAPPSGASERRPTTPVPAAPETGAGPVPAGTRGGGPGPRKAPTAERGFPSSRLCTPRVEREPDGWWLVCRCPAGGRRGSGSIPVGDREQKEEIVWSLASKRAKMVKWQCP